MLTCLLKDCTASLILDLELWFAAGELRPPCGGSPTSKVRVTVQAGNFLLLLF